MKYLILGVSALFMVICACSVSFLFGYEQGAADRPLDFFQKNAICYSYKDEIKAATENPDYKYEEWENDVFIGPFFSLKANSCVYVDGIENFGEKRFASYVISDVFTGDSYERSLIVSEIDYDSAFWEKREAFFRIVDEYKNYE